MPPLVEELHGSNTGTNQEVTVGWLVTGVFTYVDAVNLLQVNESLPGAGDGTPGSFGGLPKQSVTCKEISEQKGLYYGQVVYSYDSGKKAPVQTGFAASPTTLNLGYSWNVSLRNKKYRWLGELADGIASVQSTTAGPDPDAAPPGDFPIIDYSGMNWQGEERGFEGFEIPTPEASFSLNYKPAETSVTEAYLEGVESTVGKTNDVSFFGKAAGEVLLTGARGESRTPESWSFTFDFLVAKDRTNVACGNSITLPTVAGWDFIEVTMERKRETVGGAKVMTEIPRQVRIIRPFQRADFATILEA